MRRLVVATRSAHKLREIASFLEGVPRLELLDLGAAGIPPAPEEEAVEAFDTFQANALAKARYFAERTALPVLADDSGLCVDALDGAPGVRSKRFSGASGDAADAANNRHLLYLLRDVPDEARQAHYTCVLALVEGEEEHLFVGSCHGRILREPRGTGGFGYDPLFLVPEEGRTFAEMTTREKNRISHRARALDKLAYHLRRASG